MTRALACARDRARLTPRRAAALGELAHAVMLDEPSNHLDLPSVERLEAALRAFPGALVLVTHDERLAAALTTTTWTVGGGRVAV